MRAILLMLPNSFMEKLGSDVIKNIWHSMKVVADADSHQPFESSIEIMATSLAQVYSKVPKLFSE